MPDRKSRSQYLCSINLPIAHTDTRDLRNSYFPKRSGTSRNFAKSRTDYSLYVVNYVRILGGLLLKSTIKHSGTRSIATWQTRRLCYCPAVFFHHLRLIALSFAQEKIWRTFHFSRTLLFNFFFTF